MRILFISTWSFDHLIRDKFHNKVKLLQHAGHTPIIIFTEKNNDVSRGDVRIKEVSNEFFTVKCLTVISHPICDVSYLIQKEITNLLQSLKPDVCHIDNHEIDSNLVMSIINNGIPYILDLSVSYTQHALSQLKTALVDHNANESIFQFEAELTQAYATINLSKSKSLSEYMQKRLNGYFFTIRDFENEKYRSGLAGCNSKKTVGLITTSLDQVCQEVLALNSSNPDWPKDNIIFKVIDLSDRSGMIDEEQQANDFLQFVDLTSSWEINDFFNRSHLLVLINPRMAGFYESELIRTISTSIVVTTESQHSVHSDNIYLCQHQTNKLLTLIMNLLSREENETGQYYYSLEQEMFYHEALYRDLISHFSS